MEIRDRITKLQGGGGVPAFVSFTNVPQPQPTAPYVPATDTKQTTDQDGNTGIIDKNMLKALYEKGLISDTMALARKFDLFFNTQNNPFNKNSTLSQYKLLIPALAALREGKEQLKAATDESKKNDAFGEIAISSDLRYYVWGEDGNPTLKNTLEEGDRYLTYADLADLRANDERYAGANNMAAIIATGVGESQVRKYIWDTIAKIGSDSESREFLKNKKGRDIKDGIDQLIQEGQDGVYKIGQSKTDQTFKAQLALKWMLNEMPAKYKALLKGKAGLLGLDPNEGALQLVANMVQAGTVSSVSTTVQYDTAATKGIAEDKDSKKSMEISPIVAYQTGKLGSPFQMQINPGQSYSMVVDALQYGQPLDQSGKPIENGSLEQVLKNTGFGTFTNIGNGVYIGNQKVDPMQYSQVYTDTSQMARAWLPAVSEADGTVHPDYNLLDEYSKVQEEIKELGPRATVAQVERIIYNSPLSVYLDHVSDDGTPIWNQSKFKPFLMLNTMASGKGPGFFGSLIGLDSHEGVINPDTLGNWGTNIKSMTGIDEKIQKAKIQNALGMEMKGDIYSTIAYIPISDSTTRAMLASGEYPIMTRENPVAINDYRSVEAQEARNRKMQSFQGASVNKL